MLIHLLKIFSVSVMFSSTFAAGASSESSKEPDKLISKAYLTTIPYKIRFSQADLTECLRIKRPVVTTDSLLCRLSKLDDLFGWRNLDLYKIGAHRAIFHPLTITESLNASCSLSVKTITYQYSFLDWERSDSGKPEEKFSILTDFEIKCLEKKEFDSIVDLAKTKLANRVFDLKMIVLSDSPESKDQGSKSAQKVLAQIPVNDENCFKGIAAISPSKSLKNFDYSCSIQNTNETQEINRIANEESGLMPAHPSEEVVLIEEMMSSSDKNHRFIPVLRRDNNEWYLRLLLRSDKALTLEEAKESFANYFHKRLVTIKMVAPSDSKTFFKKEELNTYQRTISLPSREGWKGGFTNIEKHSVETGFYHCQVIEPDDRVAFFSLRGSAGFTPNLSFGVDLGGLPIPIFYSFPDLPVFRKNTFNLTTSTSFNGSRPAPDWAAQFMKNVGSQDEYYAKEVCIHISGWSYSSRHESNKLEIEKIYGRFFSEFKALTMAVWK